MAITSIFGLCFMSVCQIKSNCYSLIYSSLVWLWSCPMSRIMFLWVLFFSWYSMYCSLPLQILSLKNYLLTLFPHSFYCFFSLQISLLLTLRFPNCSLLGPYLVMDSPYEGIPLLLPPFVMRGPYHLDPSYSELALMKSSLV